MNILKKWLNFRTRTEPITGIILHATGGSSVIGSLETLTLRKLSYHYIIDRNGEVTKCIPLSKVGFHAGKSFGWSGANCNSYTIGISFANWDNGKEKLTVQQYAAVAPLIDEICKEYPDIKYLSTHYAVSPGRKSDPRQCDVPLINNQLKRKLIIWGNVRMF